MAPVVPLLTAAIGVFTGWIIKATTIPVCNCKQTKKETKPVDGTPHPSGDGRTWSQFHGDWKYIGVKP